MNVLLYTLIIRCYQLGGFILSMTNRKARKWHKGQSHFKGVDIDLLNNQKVVWFHCASVGEFEQARPIIERLKQDGSSHKILLTFYSPSGFELRKNYEFADCVTYLPLDVPSKVEAFLDRFQPDAVVFIKYELWFNFIRIIRERGIPMALVCAHFPENHMLFKPYFKWFAKHLDYINEIQVQNEGTQIRLGNLGLKNVRLSGDTRVDRVLEVSQLPFEDEFIERFIQDNKVLVVGSFWLSDFKKIIRGIAENKNLKIIVAPHELNEANQLKWEQYFDSEFCLWSKRNEIDGASRRVLYIDKIGLLSKLYRFATIAYVGGGFESNVHNVLEPAVYGLPVIFGPNNGRFSEIQSLKEIHGGFEIRSSDDFAEVLTSLNDDEKRSVVRRVNTAFFEENKGATTLALDWIKSVL